MEWKEFQIRIRCKAIGSIEVNELPAEIGDNAPVPGFVRELVLKMKSGAIARGKGDDLQECFDNLPAWVKVDG